MPQPGTVISMRPNRDRSRPLSTAKARLEVDSIKEQLWQSRLALVCAWRTLEANQDGDEVVAAEILLRQEIDVISNIEQRLDELASSLSGLLPKAIDNAAEVSHG